jgi:hypothetical protein
MKPFAVGMLACGPVDIAEVAQARPQCLASTPLNSGARPRKPIRGIEASAPAIARH